MRKKRGRIDYINKDNIKSIYLVGDFKEEKRKKQFKRVKVCSEEKLMDQLSQSQSSKEEGKQIQKIVITETKDKSQYILKQKVLKEDYQMLSSINSNLQVILRNARKKEAEQKNLQILEKIKQREAQQEHSKIFREINQSRNKELSQSIKRIQGKISTVWLFLIDRYHKRSLNMYNVKNLAYIPVLYSLNQLNKFLTIEKAHFKIVVSKNFLEQTLKNHNDYSKIIQFMIYFPMNDLKTRRKLYKIRKNYKKVKKIYSQLAGLFNKASQQIDDDIISSKIGKSKGLMKFPTFLRLNGVDKEEITNYRVNLCSAIKMLNEERPSRFLDFMDHVYEKYSQIQRENQYIKQYVSHSHFHGNFSDERCFKILNFWTKQSFYYKQLNNLLRVSQSPEQFQKCSLPFNQNYRAIQYFYRQYLRRNNYSIPKMTLYRGVKMLKDQDEILLKSFLREKAEDGEIISIPKSEWTNLQPLYIQIYGFLSTSKSLEKVKRLFTDQKRIIFVIQIEETQDKVTGYEDYDHGFADLTYFDIPDQQMMPELEVLFNPLNVFKVKKVEQQLSDGGMDWTFIYLQYGSIFQLIRKKRYGIKLLKYEKEVLVNYEYFTSIDKIIQDTGDVFKFVNQPQYAKEYYKMKIEVAKEEQSHKDLSKYYQKKSIIHQELGQIKEAEDSVEQSLKACQKDKNQSQRQRCLKVFSIHRSKAENSLRKQDYLEAQKSQEKALSSICQIEQKTLSDKINEGNIYRSLGQIQFKCGEILKSEEKLNISSDIYHGLLNQTAIEREQLRNQYFWKKIISLLTCNCSEFTRIDEHFRRQELQINKNEKKISEQKDTIFSELNKLYSSMKQVSLYANNKRKYEWCMNKAFEYLAQIAAKNSRDPLERAKLKVMEATLKSFYELAESQKLVYEAIELVEKNAATDHPLVGEYSKVIGKIQKTYLEKKKSADLLLSLEKQPEFEDDYEKKVEALVYNPSEQQKIAENCEKNYQMAINILLYHNQGSESQQVLELKNQIGDLHYNMEKFQSCEEVLQQVLKQNQINSKISNAHFLFSKVAYSRGQMQLALNHVETAEQILYETLVKKDTNKYRQIFTKSDLRTNIALHRTRIYHKQLKPQKSLMSLEEQKIIVLNKFRDSEGNPYIADILVFMGEAHCQKEQKDQFIKCFQQSIEIQKQQSGSSTSQMARTFYTFAFNHLFINPPNLVESKKYLEKSAQILRALPLNHPKMWPLHFCNAKIELLCGRPQKSLGLLQQTLNILVRSFDHEHITISKVRQFYLECLLEVQKKVKSFRQKEDTRKRFKCEFQQLEKDMKYELRKSHKRLCQKNQSLQTEQLSYEGDEKLKIMAKLQFLKKSQEKIAWDIGYAKSQDSKLQL